jgi:hypothetical protein
MIRLGFEDLFAQSFLNALRDKSESIKAGASSSVPANLYKILDL